MNINYFGPFDASVWGTVSDWVMVSVTILTAIFLIRTFKSQKKVQIMQQSITDIENERYRIEYRPKFEIIPLKIESRKEGERVRSVIHFKLKLIENEAKNVEVIDKLGTYSIEKISISKNSIGQHMPISIIHSKSEYDLHFIGLTNTTLFEIEGGYFFFSLNFKDSIGNIYTQSFTISFKDTDVSCSPSNAERVVVQSEKQSRLNRLISWIND